MTNIVDLVKEKYGAVARSGLSNDHAGVKAVAEAFGYSGDELSSIPAEANMGLSCGNPTASASLRPGVPKLQVMPYSRLSRPDATTWMTRVRPHAIVADEAHRLRNRDSATVSRVDRYLKDNPGTRVVAWSGSITTSSAPS